MNKLTIARIYLGLVALGLVVGVLIPELHHQMLIGYGAVALTFNVVLALVEVLGDQLKEKSDE